MANEPVNPHDAFFKQYLSHPQVAVDFLRQHLPPHPDNVKFTGTVPAEVDAREEHRRHLENKHR